VDSETEAGIKKSESDALKPEINGEVITNGVTETDHSAHEDTNEIILPLPDPSVFSNGSAKLVWENGIGTFPGTALKVSLEILDIAGDREFYLIKITTLQVRNDR